MSTAWRFGGLIHVGHIFYKAFICWSLHYTKLFKKQILTRIVICCTCVDILPCLKRLLTGHIGPVSPSLLQGKYGAAGPICLVTQQRPHFKLFIICSQAGLYIAATWMKSFLTLREHVRADMGSWERAVIGLESLSILLIFLAHLSHCDKVSFCDRSLTVVRLLTIDLNDKSS